MKRRMKDFDLVFFNNWVYPGAFNLIDVVSGSSPANAIAERLPELVEEIRDSFVVPDRVTDDEIKETTFILEDMISVKEIEQELLDRRKPKRLTRSRKSTHPPKRRLKK